MPGIGVIIIFTVSVDISIIYCFKAEIFKPHPLFIQRHICITRRDKRTTSITKPVTLCGIQKKCIFPYLENNETLVHYRWNDYLMQANMPINTHDERQILAIRIIILLRIWKISQVVM